MLLLGVVLIFIRNLEFISCFNLDVNFPILYTDPIISSSSSSYFGYSVILNEKGNVPWIQIGSPKANSSVNRGVQSGGIFKCHIYGPCNFIDLNTFDDSGVKKNSWIGGVMDFNEMSNRIVVCGHRWVKNGARDNLSLGICYWSNANDNSYSKLLPFDHYNAVIYAENQAVFYYGQGQAGISARIINNENNTELLLGAPGVFNWAGTTLIYTDSSFLSPSASRLVRQKHQAARKDDFTKFSQLNVANTIHTPETAAFGLFGYSVASGHFFKKSELLYVSSSPTSKNYIGQVLIYKFASRDDQPLIVKDLRQGGQFGEYFGASLAVGDLNSDGLDDLIVGAPFYTSNEYNEGRIFIFLGSPKGTLQTPNYNAKIVGKSTGAQFGLSLAYLGDMDLDNYGDIAVGAPYENDESGVVYIFRGSSLGIHSKPSQRIIGKNIALGIKGFGISFSNPSDIDHNMYKDLAIGAYKSNQVVLLRSKPVVALHHLLYALTSTLEHKTKTFNIQACFWYEGVGLPSNLTVTRKIKVDELLHRAFLSTESSTKQISLYANNITCEDISISLKTETSNRYDPITVSVSEELIESAESRAIYVNEPNPQDQDKFCKSCPTINRYKSSKEETIELPFALGCGSDNICRSKLELDIVFLNINNNQFILGSSDYLSLNATISNQGEKAYRTQLLIELPNFVYFRSTPSYCIEQNSSSVILCNVENPLDEEKQKSIILDLDMKGLYSQERSRLNFTFNILTSSNNTNNNQFFKALKILKEADMVLTGKSSQQSYSYGNNITYGKPNFTQVFQVEKIGVSPIDEVLLTLNIPTEILYKTQMINFLKLYTPEGYHAGQPIKCYSDTPYLVEEKLVDSVINPKNTKAVEEESNYWLVKRSASEFNQKLIDNDTITEFPSNRTFYLNCSNSDVVCSSISCSIGPFKSKQNVAVIHIKMLLDVSSLSELLGNKDIVIVSTSGTIKVINPPNFNQNGDRSDFVKVSSTFIGETLEPIVDLWIVVGAVVIGLLLLMLLVLGLIKAGFFQRKKKLELQALIQTEEEEKFKSDCTAPCEDKDEDFRENNIYEAEKRL